MPITTTTSLTGFWIAMADAVTGAKTAVETQLWVAPTRVDYPNAALGDMVETADGRVVVQVSNRDPRRRMWIWSNFNPTITLYERQYRWLQQLTARRRLALGLSPYIYVYDGTTNLLNVNRSYSTTVTSVAGRVLTIPALPSTGTSAVAVTNLVNAAVEVLPATSGGSANPYERRSVIAATSTTLTLDNALTSNPNASQLLVTWSEPAWWKARVLDTTRELRDDGGTVKYPVTKFSFVIDEEMPV